MIFKKMHTTLTGEVFRRRGSSRTFCKKMGGTMASTGQPDTIMKHIGEIFLNENLVPKLYRKNKPPAGPRNSKLALVFKSPKELATPTQPPYSNSCENEFPAKRREPTSKQQILVCITGLIQQKGRYSYSFQSHYSSSIVNPVKKKKPKIIHFGLP